jgi:transcriptional regulator with XRE-family HTH domain
MELREYLKEKGIRQGVFATRIGVTQSAISQIITKRVKPRPSLAVRIELETGGLVRADNLIFGEKEGR